MKEALKTLWKRLDGNRTIIGSNIILVLTLCPIPDPYKTISIAIVGLLTGASFIDHIKKGSFSTKKMVPEK